MKNQRSILLSLALALLLVCSSAQTGNAQSQLKDAAGADVFTVVEDMPIPWLYKTECREVATAEKTDCYMARLNEWLAQRLVYPSRAIKEKTEGTVVVRFIVDRSGDIREAEVLKDIGNGCGQAAVKAILSMPDWIPGRQRGVPVNVSYTIPVTFELRK